MQFHSSQSSNSNHSSQSSSTGSQRKNNSNKCHCNTNTSYTSNSLDGARWETVMTTLRSMNQVQKANEKLLRQLLETNVSLPLQKKENNEKERIQQEEEHDDDEEQEAESTQPKQEPDPVVLQLSAKVTSMEELVTRLEKKLATQEKKMLESQNKQNKPLWSNDDHKDISKRRQEARHLVANGRKRRRRG
jgi:hypothetical protein